METKRKNRYFPKVPIIINKERKHRRFFSTSNKIDYWAKWPNYVRFIEIVKSISEDANLTEYQSKAAIKAFTNVIENALGLNKYVFFEEVTKIKCEKPPKINYEKPYKIAAWNIVIEIMLNVVSKYYGITIEQLIGKINQSVRKSMYVRARSVFCYWAVKSMPQSAVSEYSGIKRNTIQHNKDRCAILIQSKNDNDYKSIKLAYECAEVGRQIDALCLIYKI